MISQRDVAKGKVLVSAAAIIEGVEHEILLIWEGDMPYHKWWVIPGGYVKPKETVEQAVVREVKEETGLEIIPTKLVGIYDDFIYNGESGPIHHIIIAYTADVVGGRIIFSQEATAYKWLSVEEALNSPELPTVFKRILHDFRKQKPARLVSRLRKIFDICFGAGGFGKV
jgi:ADP-ribose pyrophosphatase YjhB (NUDIX family)